MRRAIALGLAVATTGCPDASPPDADPPVIEISREGATVVSLTRGQVARRLARVRLERGDGSQAPLSVKLRDALLDQMINEALLLAEADQRGVTTSSATVERALAAMRADSSGRALDEHMVAALSTEGDLRDRVTARQRVRRLMDAVVGEVAPTDAELEAAWAALPEAQRREPARVRARHIVVRTEEEASRVMKALKRGGDFAELAREHSIGPEAERGGDLGWFARGEMPAVFDQVCFALAPGQTSKVQPSAYGFHIFRVEAAKPAAERSFESARASLKAKIEAEKRAEAEAAYLAKLRSGVNIVRDEDALAGLR